MWLVVFKIRCKAKGNFLDHHVHQ